jgi:hypothetical protein
MPRRFSSGKGTAIMSILRAVFIAVALLGVLPAVSADDEPGHSHHGAAFDSGLRQRPWHMEGIGKTHFPITTKVPEVQEWFGLGESSATVWGRRLSTDAPLGVPLVLEQHVLVQ